MKMKLQNQKMLSLFLVALIVFVGVGQSLLAVHAESNKTENITVTLEAGEGTDQNNYNSERAKHYWCRKTSSRSKST